MKFDRANWQKNWMRGDMIFEIVHYNTLVGKNRMEIPRLLGEPFFSETKNQERKRIDYFNSRKAEKEPFNKFDWFALSGPGCTPADPGLYLEILYRGNLLQGDTAVGYRLVKSNHDKDGVKEIFGNMLTLRQGFCQPISGHVIEAACH